MGLVANKLPEIYTAIDLLGNIHVASKKKWILMNLYKISHWDEWFITTLFVLTQMVHNLNM